MAERGASAAGQPCRWNSRCASIFAKEPLDSPDRFALFLPCFLVFWSTSFGHYLVPVFPILILLAVHGLRFAVLEGNHRFLVPIPTLRIVLPLLAILPLLVSSFEEFTRYRQPTARALAREWIEDSVPPGSIFASEPGGPPIREPHLVVVLPIHTTDPAQSTPAYNPTWYEPIDMILLVEGVERRYRAETDSFPDQIHFYGHIDKQWERVARFGKAGEGIRIYRNPDSNRKGIRSYPDTLYARLAQMDRVLAGRFLVRLGTAFRETGRFELAGDVYNRLVRTVPDNQDYALAYADVLLLLEDRPLAIRLLESRQASGDEHLHASLHFLKGEYERAAAAWTRYAESHPGNIQVRVNLARIFLTMDKPKEALSWYLGAIEAGVNDIEPYLGACTLLARLGKTEQAALIARKGLKKWPESAELRKWGG